MNDKLYNDLLEYCNYDLKEVEDTIKYFKNRLQSEENYAGLRDVTTLEQAIIDEIDMVLECNFDSYETGLELSDEKKLEIAQDIINKDYQIWEDLHTLVFNYIKNSLTEEQKIELEEYL